MMRLVFGVYRSTWHTPRKTPAASAARTAASHPAWVPEIGFSQRMSYPAAANASMAGK